VNADNKPWLVKFKTFELFYQATFHSVAVAPAVNFNLEAPQQVPTTCASCIASASEGGGAVPWRGEASDVLVTLILFRLARTALFDKRQPLRSLRSNFLFLHSEN
jgi:hypothetical protein